MKKQAIRIGVVLPLSGDEELFGSQGLQGARMAVSEVNAAGGVLGGRPLELIIEDEKTDLKTAIQKTEKVILQDKVIAVMGPTSSAHRDAMIEICTRHRTPLLYGADYEGGCCYRYLFCYSPIPDHYVKPLIPYLIKNYGKTFYLLGADYVWPIQMSAAIKAEVLRSGGSVVGEEYLAFEIKDFDGYLRKITQSGATIVVMMLSGLAGQIFIRRFSELGLQGKVKLVVPAFNENYLAGLGKKEAEGIVTCNPFLANLNRAEAKDFVSRQKKMFGPNTVVSYFVESHYGLILFLKNAIEKAKTDDKEKVIDAMADQTQVVGNGPVTLRASDHHMVLNMLIAEVKGGDLVMTQYIGPVEPADQCAGKNKA